MNQSELSTIAERRHALRARLSWLEAEHARLEAERGEALLAAATDVLVNPGKRAAR
jgi:hypothetical protein